MAVERRFAIMHRFQVGRWGHVGAMWGLWGHVGDGEILEDVGCVEDGVGIHGYRVRGAQGVLCREGMSAGPCRLLMVVRALRVRALQVRRHPGTRLQDHETTSHLNRTPLHPFAVCISLMPLHRCSTRRLRPSRRAFVRSSSSPVRRPGRRSGGTTQPGTASRRDRRWRTRAC